MILNLCLKTFRSRPISARVTFDQVYLMNKPDFSQMSNRELKRYLIHHHNDEQAWEEFTSRPRLHRKQYPPPFDELSIAQKYVEVL